MRLPIRARLTLTSGALMAVVLIALGSFVFLRLQAELIAAVDAGLRSRADVLLARIGEGGLIGGGALVEGDEAFAQLLDAAGRVVQSSDGLADEPLVDPDVVEGEIVFGSRVTTEEETVPARLLAVTITGGGALVVGASLEDQQDALGLLLTQLLIGGPVAVALASVVGWLSPEPRCGRSSDCASRPRRSPDPSPAAALRCLPPATSSPGSARA